MSKSLDTHITLGTWECLRKDAYLIRHEVFVVEQAVPVEIELDDDDASSLHAVAYNANQEPIATGRLLPDGHIGRMAVRKSARGSGIGGQVLQALIARGQGDGHRTLLLNAQTHARRFYEAYGFTGYGEEFLDAGIPHIAMRRDLGE